MRFSMHAIITLFAFLLVACSTQTKLSQDYSLQTVNCPKLQAIKPDEDGGISMGRLLTEYVTLAGTYNECRASALGLKP